MDLDADAIFSRTIKYSPLERKVIEYNPHDNVSDMNLSTSRKSLGGGFVPQSYSQLISYGYRIMSERHAGTEGFEDFESKYTIVSKNRKLNRVEKEIFNKSLLINCPSFIKIYLKRTSGNEALICLRKERFGKITTFPAKRINLNM